MIANDSADIVIVEDNATDMEMTIRVLRKHAGLYWMLLNKPVEAAGP